MAILQCGFCGKKINTLLSGKYKYLDGTMCVECFRNNKKELTPLILKFKKTSKEEILNILNPHRQELIWVDFTPTQEIGGIQFDDNSKRIHIPAQESHQNNTKTVFAYSDILDVEIAEDGETITKGTLGGVLMGDMIAGTAGAIIGSNIGKKNSKNQCTKLAIKFLLNSDVLFREYYLINNPKKSVKKDSEDYNQAYITINSILSKIKSELNS